MFGLSELAIILIVVVAIMLAKKGPELARNAGKSARILKAEARAMKEAEEQQATDTPPGSSRARRSRTARSSRGGRHAPVVREEGRLPGPTRCIAL
ncbi:twin-arginine translocase TatA/TatE family subunit [Streptomyces sp. MNU103]|uniref:twin-arginine translocase TatA/TatE family subunit n=1 Tax=Streptomyces sp. MNU103 TaxID=2560024 RepID=UPI001E46CBBE|nr:twin-arginine translocase TatA/TatE family subunit [Streptomyces sp. MNU103]